MLLDLLPHQHLDMTTSWVNYGTFLVGADDGHASRLQKAWTRLCRQQPQPPRSGSQASEASR